MLYIKKNMRVHYNGMVDNLASLIHTNGCSVGDINYVVTRLLRIVFASGMSYSIHNSIIGVLESIKLEWYRRQTSPYEDEKMAVYEDEKMAVNGDIDLGRPEEDIPSVVE